MEFRALGPVTVIDDRDQEVSIGGPKPRTVLAMLLAEEGRALTTERLIDGLWGAEPPRTAAQSLRSHISRLRAIVGDRLRHDMGSYVLGVGDDIFDVASFRRLCRTAEAASADDAVVLLEDALRLWRGEAFAGIDARGALDGAVRMLSEERMAAREALATALVDAGYPSRAVGTAEAVVADAPLREGAWAALIRALAADGRPADALRAFQRAVDVLAEAGLEPTEALRSAEADALSGERPASADVRAVTVSYFSSSLRGRDTDLHSIAGLLDEARLVTLVGPGGVGKTRLAVEVALAREAAHRSGIRVVELGRVKEPSEVVAAASGALGISESGGPPDAAVRRAADLDVLVVLDNCEHVIEAAAEVAELLTGGPGRARVLATSRERLGVEGEQSWPVAPLATESSGPAVQLFLDRVSRQLPSFAIDEEVRDRVARLVRDLDGLPLAIEMAAARAPALGLAGLEEALAGPLDVLRSARRRGSPRHRTLGAVIEWSEELLSDRERVALMELSVFAGPVTASDVTAVLTDPDGVTAVGDLAERSLVVVDHDEPVRYRLLELIRRHGRRRLDEAGRDEEVGARHAQHFLDVARAAEGELWTEREAEVSRRLDESLAELRLAHAWGRQHDPRVAIAISARLHEYGVTRQRLEVVALAAGLEPILDQSSDAAVVLATLAYQANSAGELDRAERYGERSLEVAGDRPVRRFALECLADTALYRGDLVRGRELGQELSEAASEVDDQYLVMIGRSDCCLGLAYDGHLEAALDLVEGAANGTTCPSIAGWAAYSEGEAILDIDPSRALGALDRAAALADEVGNRFLGAVSRVSTVTLLGRHGETDEALRRFASVIDHWHERGDHTHQLTTLRNLVHLLVRLGADREAAELLGAVAADRGVPTFGPEAARLAEATARVEKSLQGEFDQIRTGGANLDMGTAAVRALAMIDGLRD